MTDPRDEPLGTLVEQVLGPLPNHLGGSGVPSSTIALANWYRLVLVLAAEEYPIPLERPSMERTKTILWGRMTIWHKQAFRLLYEWWTASYQDSSISLASILEYVDGCTRLDQSDEKANIDAWQNVLHILELKRWPLVDVRRPKNNRSMSYDATLRTLFNWEFGDDSVSYAGRRSQRSLAAMYAYCQQVSWQLFYHGPQQPPNSVSSDMKDMEDDRNQITTKPSRLNVLEKLWNDQDPLACMVTRGPIIEACPWLERHERDAGDLPYYLWDVENEATIETSKLDPSSYPEYTAISHTWGRWTTGESIRIPNVPWMVPQNTKFRVEELPSAMKRVPGLTSYIWLDLLCIPQNDSIIGAREISRQARIFNGARHVVAWLNDVQSFEGLECILKWQSLHLLHFQDKDDEDGRLARIEEAWINIAWKQSGLFKPRTGKLEYANLSPNAWFTSLWTLQEVALRPDLWICTGDWNFLTMDGLTPLPFSGFLAITEIFWQNNPDKRNYPFSPEAEEQSYICLFELGLWRFETGLHRILGLDRIALLTLGDRRECKERRAEAIMSALGITRWYDQMLEEVEQSGGSQQEFHAKLEQTLVLEKYPISFVRALSTEVPGDFFASFLRMNFDPHRETGLSSTPGSMLPFSETKSYYAAAGGFRSTNFQIESQTHPTIAKWRIHPIGTVSVPEACIIYSTRAERHKTVDSSAIIPVQFASHGPGSIHNTPLPEGFTSIHGDNGFDFGDREWANFGLWMSRQEAETYAVIVKSQLSPSLQVLALSGIIIKRNPAGFLYKWNMFFAVDEHFVVDLTQVESVDLVVQ